MACTSAKKVTSTDCIENSKFKERYFSSIEKVDNYILEKGDWKEYKKGLEFIAKYTKVSYDRMLNYNNSYTSIEDYKRDKENWLKWYEENKCKNVQIK